MKNLENYGVQELNAQEIKETDGGVLGIDDIIAGIIIGAAIAIINDCDNFTDGFFSAFN